MQDKMVPNNINIGAHMPKHKSNLASTFDLSIIITVGELWLKMIKKRNTVQPTIQPQGADICWKGIYLLGGQMLTKR